MESIIVATILFLFSSVFSYLAVRGFILAHADQRPLGYLLGGLLSFCVVTALIHSPGNLRTYLFLLAAIGSLIGFFGGESKPR